VSDFARQGSIVRRIWGDGDMVLFVFAGSAAEFALNRAVDWLFFTGRLPADPIGRLFDTAGYAQHIVFADEVTASATLERIRAVHHAVERQRGQSIPDWAHRDVLYMLIDYSERSHELLARPLTEAERHELYDVFYRVGTGLGIPGLPLTYAEWRTDRDIHMRRDLVNSEGTAALYARYRQQLGFWRYGLLLRLQSILAPEHVRGLRYGLLLRLQSILAPEHVRGLMGLRSAQLLRRLVRLYPILVRAGLRPVIQWLLMPAQYLPAVRRLDLEPHPSRSARHTLTTHAPGAD
jgi:uncharacterized protein (DUF2236 family)